MADYMNALAPPTPASAPMGMVPPQNALAGSYPGMMAPGNIDLMRRPVVRNPDGSISTVRSMGVNIDGREVLIPTVSPDGRILSPQDAINLYRRSGQHLGMFATPEASTAYAKALHEQQAQTYLGK